MKEYVAVPDALLKKTKELQQYLEFQLRICEDAEAKANEEEDVSF
jgi:hypothetical protein